MMHSLQGDIEKLCTDALSTGRGAFTYATYLRVNLTYKAGAGWALIGVPMPDSPLAPQLGGEANDKIAMLMLADMIAQRIGSGLKFSPPQSQSIPGGQTAYLMHGSGGPTGASVAVDRGAAQRLVRYAKRDGSGEVNAHGWRLRLHRDDVEWSLDATADHKPDHHALGMFTATVQRLLGKNLTLRKAP